MIINKIKQLFKKRETFPCIIWDGKTMSYSDLTQKEIDQINTLEKYKDWTVSLKNEC